MNWYPCGSGSGGGSSSGYTYSTTEQVIGTWTDGRQVCELVVELQSEVILSGWNWYSTDISNSDKAIMLSATSISSSGMCFPLGCTRDSDGILKIMNLRNANVSCKTLIIRYVKTAS